MKGLPLLLSYCCGIPESKDISAEGHYVAIKIPSVSRMVTRDYNVSGEMAGERSARDTKMITIGFL